MLRKIFLALSLIILLTGAVPSKASLDTQAVKYPAFDFTRMAFSELAEEEKEITLMAWGRIEAESLTETYQRFKEAFLFNDHKAALQKEESFLSLSYLEVRDIETWQLSLQSVAPFFDQEVFLGVLYTTHDDDQAKRVYVNLCALLKELGLDEKLGITYQTVIAKTLLPDERMTLVQNIAESFHANYVEGYHEGNLLSSSYYSPKCSEYLLVNGQKINLQIAVRTNEKDNITKIYIGSPLIYQEY